MRARTLLVATAIISAILGAVVVYLVLTVPNDIQANVLLKQARTDLAAGKTDKARDVLSKIVQEYPRTDAAAAATVALVKIGDEERKRVQDELDALRRDRDRQSAVISQLQTSVEDVKNAPPKVIVQAPAPAPQKKKAPAHHTKPHHHRRRR